MARSSRAPTTGNAYSIATLRASLEVLNRFGERDAWSLADLTQEVGQGKSRVFRILATFEECGYLTRDTASGQYRPGPRLVALSASPARYEQLRWQALPPLQMLAEDTGETAHVGILFGTEVVTVQLVEGRHEVRMHSSVGKRSPANASSLGKVLLAYFPEPEIDEYLRTTSLTRMTPHSIVDPSQLKEHLRNIRSVGYAFDNEELQVGLRCVAAPITDHTSRVVASVSISAPTFRLDEQGAVRLAPRVTECARTISRMLGSPSLKSGLP
jgi:DNA-binding IclR family transcriptional regulator